MNAEQLKNAVVVGFASNGPDRALQIQLRLPDGTLVTVYPETKNSLRFETDKVWQAR